MMRQERVDELALIPSMNVRFGSLTDIGVEIRESTLPPKADTLTCGTDVHFVRSGHLGILSDDQALLIELLATLAGDQVTGGLRLAVFRDGRFPLSNVFDDRFGLGKKIVAEHFTCVQVS